MLSWPARLRLPLVIDMGLVLKNCNFYSVGRRTYEKRQISISGGRVVEGRLLEMK